MSAVVYHEFNCQEELFHGLAILLHQFQAQMKWCFSQTWSIVDDDLLPTSDLSKGLFIIAIIFNFDWLPVINQRRKTPPPERNPTCRKISQYCWTQTRAVPRFGDSAYTRTANSKTKFSSQHFLSTCTILFYSEVQYLLTID